MFMHAVVDPEAFTEEELKTKERRKEAEIFLKALFENVFVVTDQKGALKKALIRQIEELSTCTGQYLKILLGELLKKQRTHIVRSRATSIGDGAGESDSLCSQVAKACDADGVIASSTLAKHLMFGSDADVYPLLDYSRSNFESKRRGYESGLEPFGQKGKETYNVMSDKEAEEVFIRIMKFAKWLRFYDKQIGRANNISGFRRGIRYILKLWKDTGHFADSVSCPIEIITSQAKATSDPKTEHVKEKDRVTNKQNKRKLENRLLKPLRESFPWEIELKIQPDRANKFHARQLQAQQVIVHIDRGFDLFCDGRPRRFKRNHIRLDNMSRGHLEEYRALGDRE